MKMMDQLSELSELPDTAQTSGTVQDEAQTKHWKEKQPGFTHFDSNGNALMVDVSEKADTVREALATGSIQVSDEVYQAVASGKVKKGDVLSIAAAAGIMGAKRTSELIPMCHILPLTGCRVWFEMEPQQKKIRCFCEVKITGKTGVEMEALTGVSTALLTIYDMCKAMDKSMEIGEIYLRRKTGGRSGEVLNHH